MALTVADKTSDAKTRVRRPRPAARPPAGEVSSPAEFKAAFDTIVDNVELVIKGKDQVVRLLLVAMLAEGHVLLEDMPGTGKTMLARAIAQTIDATVSRLQATPDLLPSDVTGAPVFDQRSGEFHVRRGPIFTNILLVDEINRATPKTQSALLEAMQERRVTIDNTTYDLPSPFVVLATENPLEQAGTFPLPEAQLDRFLLKLSVGYPGRFDEESILLANLKGEAITRLKPVTTLATVQSMMTWAEDVTIARPVMMYMIDLCQATRADPGLEMGASTRASLALMRAARVLAASQGREDVLPDDVRSLAPAILGHRCIPKPETTLRGDTGDAIIERLLSRTKVPTDSDLRG